MTGIPNYLAMIGFDVNKMKKEADGNYSLTTQQIITPEELAELKTKLQSDITASQNKIIELQDTLTKLNALG